MTVPLFHEHRALARAREQQQRSRAAAGTARLRADFDALCDRHRQQQSHLARLLAAFDQQARLAKTAPDALHAVALVQKKAGEIQRLRRTEACLSLLLAIEEGKVSVQDALQAGECDAIVACVADLCGMRVDAACANIASHLAHSQQWAKDAAHAHLQRRLCTALASLGWPKAIEPAVWQDELVLEMLRVFDSFVVFAAAIGDANVFAKAVNVMLEPISIRFHFHYATNRPTNRLDKPEWPLAHLSQIAQAHLPFLAGALALDLEQHRGSHTATGTFLNGILQIAAEHICSRKARLLADQFILLHTLAEALVFVQRMGTQTGHECAGMLRTIFGDIELAAAWLQAEESAAAAAFLKIVEGEEALDIDATLSMFEGLLDTLHALPSDGLKADYLGRVVVPLLERLHERIRFGLLPFAPTKDDLRLLMSQAEYLRRLVHTIGLDWGETLDSLALAGSAAFQKRFGYDASPLPGSIFSKSLEAFRQLEEIVQGQLYEYIWQAFAGPAKSFARAMHYGVVREGRAADLTMHDDLRRALVSLAQAISDVRPRTSPSIMEIIESRLLQSLSLFLFERVTLQNFFHQSGVRQFAADLAHIRDALSKLMPGQPVDAALQRTTDALHLLQASESLRSDLVGAAQDEDFDLVAEILAKLQIAQLTVSECEKIADLYRK